MNRGFSTTIVIEVPPATVFGFLADPSTASVIDPAVVRYEPEGGTMGLGIRNHIHLQNCPLCRHQSSNRYRNKG